MHTNIGYKSNREERIVASKHAQKRGAQRAINPNAAKLIRAFGAKDHDGKGAVRYLMTRKAVESLANVVGKTAEAMSLHGTYVVLDAATESTVITIGHRH